jgi:DNA-binding CsgD family transcriptional regulator
VLIPATLVLVDRRPANVDCLNRERYGTVPMTIAEHSTTRVRIAIVAPEPAERQALEHVFARNPEFDVVAWSDSVDPLLALGTRADVCVFADSPTDDDLARLRALGVAAVHDGPDLVAAVRAAVAAGVRQVRRPKLSERQHQVLIAYASSNDLLPTVARRLGMDPETVKTHLRRIRAKYADVDRHAPTRRDLYVRAVEDGLLPPPSGRG